MQDPRRIPPALRMKYDVRGPRYTSYPPATHFHPLPVSDLFDRWSARNSLADDPGLSLYLHVPFCRTRCSFCGCHSVVPGDGDFVERYVDALEEEMKLATGHVNPRRPVTQVAMGGGTPNFLSVGQLDRLLCAMEGTWSVSPGAERSVEIDPRTATPEKLDVFIQHGFNRFSLGVQDFDAGVLSRVRRGQDVMQVEEVVSHLRRQGCSAINFDFIYGLPGQDLATAAATARQAVRLAPSRIALYSYAHVPWIHPGQKSLEKTGLPDPDEKLALFLVMLDTFQDAGYLPVGMDHFALPGDSLARALGDRSMRRNFMGYTTGRGTDLLAFGASAISSIGSAYSQNAKGLDAYLDGIAAGTLPVEKGFLLQRDDELRREIILDLFCNFAVDLDALGERHGVEAAREFAREIADLRLMEEDGLLSLGPGAITVSETGKFFIRNICMVFDRFLAKDGTAPVYSRTV
jgi:oxygen-independent coproporphyrinogen-3 oxidase